MTLKAGAASRDITPQRACFLVGYPHVERLSTGVHDPLLASALYLENSTGHSVVFVALDLLFLDPPTARSVRRAISAQTSTPEECVFVSCTHTHSGPVTVDMLSWRDDPVVPSPDRRYLDLVQARVCEAAARAAATAQPAELAWTSARIDGVGGNRLLPEGVRDPEAGVLMVRDPRDNQPRAVSVVYSMHPTVLHEDSTLVSGDFPAFTRQSLCEALGEDVVVLYHTGPCGNQSPRYHVHGQTFAEAERLGRQLGDRIVQRVRQIRDEEFDPDPMLAGRTVNVELPVRIFPSSAAACEALGRARGRYQELRSAEADHGPVRTAECAVFGAEEAVALARHQETGEVERTTARYTPVEVQVVRAGETALVGFPGELFVEYGLEVKRRSPLSAFAVSLVNGELQGYIVTPEAAAAGGYEASNALFSPRSGALMTDAALAALRELAGERLRHRHAGPPPAPPGREASG